MTVDALAPPFRHFMQSGTFPGGHRANIRRRQWHRLTRAIPNASGYCCRCDDEGNADTWYEHVAPYILQHDEWLTWYGFSRKFARRRWLRGRVAAKDAVRLILWERCGIVAPLETISVLPDERGRPQLSAALLSEAGIHLSLSISHCENTSVACVAECPKTNNGIGVDLASHTQDHDGLAEGGFGLMK